MGQLTDRKNKGMTVIIREEDPDFESRGGEKKRGARNVDETKRPSCLVLKR